MVRTRAQRSLSPAAPTDRAPASPRPHKRPKRASPARKTTSSPDSTGRANPRRAGETIEKGALERVEQVERAQGVKPSDDRPLPQQIEPRAAPGVEERTRPRGERFSPGEGQLDYVLTAPEPTRDPLTNEFTFADFPRFKPNLSPEEVIRQGSFDGGYFRPVKSKKTGREHHEDWSDLPKEWYAGLDTSMYLTRPEGAADSVNKWQPRMGQGYEAWEANGWIVAEHDARGWFQWYCRFFRGRRCDDDERQVSRWDRVAGEASGRWRRILLAKYRKAGIHFVEPNEEPVSKGIRQTLNHWAYDPTADHLNRFRQEKGDDVANDDADELE
ncbi:hypothetical protein JCM1841_001665 [Sporobolomyces salmonicolor]